MGTVNVCLKRGFIILTSLFGAISALLLAVTLFSHGYLHGAEEMEELITGITILYALDIVTLLLAIIGLFGICKEKKWALVLFTVGMALTSFILFVELMRALPARHEVGEEIRREHQAMMPLSEATDTSKALVSGMQYNFECCGLETGYEDWGDLVPETCLCHEDDLSNCVAVPRNSSSSEESTDEEPIMIYKEAKNSWSTSSQLLDQPCLPIVIAHVILAINIVIAISMGLMLLWVVSTGLAVAILCQMRRKMDVPAVVYSIEAKAGNYTTLLSSADA